MLWLRLRRRLLRLTRGGGDSAGAHVRQIADLSPRRGYCTCPRVINKTLFINILIKEETNVIKTDGQPHGRAALAAEAQHNRAAR